MTAHPAITCMEIVELVTEYLEGALPPEERARFAAHLASCNDCTVYLDQMRKTIQSLGKLTESEIAGEAKDRLLGVFRDWKAESG